MLPHIPGPDPRAFGTLAIIVAVGLISTLAALVALVGWTAHELICLVDGHGGVWSARLAESVVGLRTPPDRPAHG